MEDTKDINIQGLSERLQTMSQILSRAQLASKMGYSYSDDRDLYEVLGYDTDIDYEDYAALYTRLDIAQAIINRPVGMTWKGPLTIMESDDDKESPLEKIWNELENELKLKKNFIRLDKLTCLGHYGVLLLGLDDVKEQKDFEREVKGGTRKLLYVKAFSEDAATINSYVTSTTDKRYGLPLIYSIELTNSEGASSTILVHYTRVIHVTQGLLESEVEGTPTLEAVYNRLKDLEKLVGGSAEMFWRGARPGYQLKMDKDVTITTETANDLQDQMDEFDHNLRRFFTTKGGDIVPLSPQVQSPKDHVDIQIQMISAVTGIPKKILTGTERGELASSQDQEAWLSMIQTRREEYAEPSIIRPFVDRLIELKILPKPAEDYFVNWQDLFSRSDKDMAEVGKIRADALKQYASVPGVEQVVPAEAFFEFMLGFDDDQIGRIKEMQKAQVNEEPLLTPEEEELLPKEDEKVPPEKNKKNKKEKEIKE